MSLNSVHSKGICPCVFNEEIVEGEKNAHALKIQVVDLGKSGNSLEALLRPFGMFIFLFFPSLSPLSSFLTHEGPQVFSWLQRPGWRLPSWSRCVFGRVQKGPLLKLGSSQMQARPIIHRARASPGSSQPWGPESEAIAYIQERLLPQRALTMYFKDVPQVASFVWLESHMWDFPI